MMLGVGGLRNKKESGVGRPDQLCESVRGRGGGV